MTVPKRRRQKVTGAGFSASGPAMRRAALLAALLATAAPLPSEAAEATADQAAAMQAQMREWLGGMLGPDVPLDDRSVRVTPDGDRYRVVVPLGTPRAGQTRSAELSGYARPAEGGRWTIEELRLPSPASFTLNMPVPPRPGSGKAGTRVPVEYMTTISSQDGLGSFDPSFATPSTLATHAEGVQVTARGPSVDQVTTIDRSTSSSTLSPSGADRFDLVTDGLIEGYALRSRGGPVTDLAAQRVRVTGAFTAVSRDRLAQIVPALVRMTGSVVAGMPKAGSKAPVGPPAFDPQLLRTVLQSLGDLASGFALDETIDGAALRYGDTIGTANQVQVGVGAKSENGLLQAHLDLGLDGLALPNSSLGAMTELLPRRVSLRPVLSGVPTAELVRWMGALDPAAGVRAPDLAALLGRGGVKAGLENIDIEVGGATFTGAGQVSIAWPESLTGQAQLSATNFDALVARVNAIPELAGIVPVLIFAKGISRTVGDRLLWDLTYRDGSLLVNGTDVSAMTGGRK